MTPCEERGWKVGDRFRVVRDPDDPANFAVGSVVELFRDDGMIDPLFRMVSGSCKYNNADGEPGAYLPLSCVEPLPKPTRFVPGETTLRDGTPARIYAVYEDRIHGANRNPTNGCWEMCEWGASGDLIAGDEHPLDLMPNAAPETLEVDVWVQWEDTGAVVAYIDDRGRPLAPESDKARRRIRVTLTEGEFDD